MADHSTEIAALEAILNGATKDVSTDGVRVALDLEEARRRLAVLRRDDDTSIAAGKVRPRILRMKLNNSW